jgi:phospholipase C
MTKMIAAGRVWRLAGAILLCLDAVAAMAQVPSSQHVFVVVESQHSWWSVVSGTTMPYLNGLINQNASATQYYANGHPSIEDYFYLTTGQFITNDQTFSQSVSADNLVRELTAAGKTWKVYAESLPSVGYLGGDDFPYIHAHNPFTYLTDVQQSSTQKQNVVPFTQFASDLSNGVLPNFSFIIPDATHDVSNCPAGISCTDSQKMTNADNWLQANVGPLIASSTFQQDGILIILFDESWLSDIGFGGGQVAMVVVSPHAATGFHSTNFYQHQNTLKLVCDALGITTCPGDATGAASMGEFFRGTPLPPVSVTPGALWYGQQAIGLPSPVKKITLTNNQSVSLNISAVSSAGDFSETDNCAQTSVPPNGQCTISVSFAPTATGPRYGTISIADNAPSQPQVVQVGGNSVPPVALSPSFLSFGQLLGGTSPAQPVLVTNNQTTNVVIASIVATGNFSQTNNCGSSLGSGQSCTVTVSFTPSVAGLDTGTLTISTNSAISPQANLSGTGIAPIVSSPISVAFGDVAVGTTSPARAITFTNNQSAAVSISGIVASTDFSQTNNCGSMLAANSSCTIQISFTPSLYSPETGTITINDNAPGNPHIVSLSGNGIGSCSPSTVNQTVVLCTPLSNANVNSPMHVVAYATSSNPITQFTVYVDYHGVYTVASNSISTYVPLTSGTHRVGTVATDSTGVSFKQVVYVNVPNSLATSIRHVIFFVQENRSYDSYFGRMGAYRQARGYNDVFDALPLNTTLKDVSNDSISPFHNQTVCTESLAPDWNSAHIDWDNGLMDNFLMTQSTTVDPNGTRALAYYDWSDMAYYYELAFQFGTSDRFFSSVMAATPLNRMYLFAASSYGHINRSDAPPSGGWPFPTIFRLLNQAKVSWRYYYQNSGLIRLKAWSDYDPSKVFPLSQYFIDLQDESTLPSVLFIESDTILDEHPANNVQLGVADAASIVNGLMQSPSWPSSVFVEAFDEYGGLYDHVPPAAMVPPDNIAPMLQTGDQSGSFNQSGFRVPFFILSPWAKPHFVSHVPRDLTAILKLIETRFSLPSLNARDASQDDMTEFFDFTQAPILTPPPLPTQPTTGPCFVSLEKAPGQ